MHVYVRAAGLKREQQNEWIGPSFYIDSFDRCWPGLGGGLGLIKFAGGVARGDGR